MSPKKDDKKVADIKPSDLDWLKGINMDNVEKVMNLNIIPKMEIPLNSMKTVKILELPKLVKYADGNEYYCMNVLYNNVIHQLNCEANSLRFHLAVLGKRLEGMDKLIGMEVVITKKKADTKDYKDVPMYSIYLPEND